MKSAVLLFVLAVAAVPSTAGAEPRWEPLPLWGGVVEVAAASHGQGPVYAATASGELYRSRDGGRTWGLAGRGPRGLPLHDLAIDPHDTRRLFAVARRFDVNEGLVRSFDGGRSWRPAGRAFARFELSGPVVFDPAVAGRVYAATWGGLYRSVDGGATWQLLAFPGLIVEAVGVVPGAAPVVLASTRDLRTEAFAIHRSLDGGATFVTDDDGRAIGFAADPSRPGRVYGFEYSALARSDDAGATWVAFTPHPPIYFGALAVTQAGTALAGSLLNGVWRSLDGGATWAMASEDGRPRPWDPVSSLVPLPDGVVAGGERGVWRGGPEGLGWRASSDGLRAHVVTPVVVAGDSTLWAGVPRSSVFQSGDGGASFRAVFRGRPAYFRRLAVHAGDPAVLYGWGGGSLISRTDDGGRSWRALRYPGAQREFKVLEVDPVDPDVVYAGGAWEPHSSPCTAVRSRDGGESWICFGPGRAIFDFDWLEIDPRDRRRLYAGFNGVPHRSRDGGDSWQPLPARGLPGLVSALAVDPLLPGRLFAAAEGGIFRSDDAGASWRRTSRGLPPGAGVTQLLIDADRPDRLYALLSDAGGVFTTADGGETWRDLSAGLPAGVALTELALDPRDPGRLYAGTEGRGLYRLDLDPR